jgi:hypothetical protein
MIDPKRGVLAMPEGPYVRLWPSAAGTLGYDSGQPIRPPVGKSRFACHSMGEPLAVAAIYEMRKAPRPDVCTIEAISGVAAMGALSRLAYRPSLIDALPGAAPRQFANAAALLRHVPLFGLPYPKVWGPMPEFTAHLEAHVEQIPR